jgi:protoporphyrinogen oxidase
MFKETLAYLEGGVEILLTALENNIKKKGGHIFLEAEVSRITMDKEKNKVTGIIVNGQEHRFDKVITTIPLPYIPRIAPGLPEEVIKKYKNLDNIGVVCVILKLSEPLTENFWLNISDRSIELPGVIEFSNLNPMEQKVVYFPFYLPGDHEKFLKPDRYFVDAVKEYCKRMNKDFAESWVLAAKVHRYEYAQPVCPPGFLQMLPPVKTAIEGFYAIDTSYYYPEDRSISESIKAARGIYPG